jgi:hypothetical protein
MDGTKTFDVWLRLRWPNPLDAIYTYRAESLPAVGDVIDVSKAFFWASDDSAPRNVRAEVVRIDKKDEYPIRAKQFHR